MSTGSLNLPGASVSSEPGVAARVKKSLRLIGRMAGINGAEGLVTYVLLGLMALVVAWSVQLAGWGDSPILIWTVLAGTALGVAFARLVGPWPLRHLVGILAGVPFSIW